MAVASSSEKRCGYNNEDDKKKKKKKKLQSKPVATGLLVVDDDPVWQKTVNLEEENSNDSAGINYTILNWILIFSVI